MAITVYILTVKQARKDGNNKPFDVVITTNSSDSGYQIKSLSFEKRLYSPCCINMELSRVNDDFGLSNIQNDFGGRSVNLEVAIGSNRTMIAEDYLVYQYNPVFANSECTISLTLYSRDKLLTLDKFNKVYLDKKLGDGIIREMLNGPLKKCDIKFDLKKDGHFDENRLQLLSYSITINQGKKDQKTTSHEVIQPYRVQYNEDFYSFISRIACRCGEFLYFEDGKLKLGLDPSDPKNPITIGLSDITRLEYPGFGNSSLTVTNCFRNYLSATTDGNSYSTASLPCSDYGAFDEYFNVLDKGNLPDSFDSEFYIPDIVNWVKDSFLPAAGYFRGGEYYTLWDKVTRAAVKFITIFGSAQANANFINNDFKKFFNSTDTQKSDGNLLSQFADVRKAGFGRLMNKQLSEIRNKEIKAAQSIVRIRVKTEFATTKKIKLGSEVTVQQDSEKKVSYRVVSCSGQYSVTKEQVDVNPITKEPITKDIITDITEFELVPVQKININGENDTESSLYIPPYDKCAESVPAPPQIAVVTEKKDPRYLGRVRVRYTWQSNTEEGSPWVRVLSPLASKSGALHFRPDKGDEVLLGYIDGNIDRPYVAGSLFNDKNKIHDSLYAAYNDTIRVGSQRLDFRSGPIPNWIESVVPFYGMVKPFIPEMSNLVPGFDDIGEFPKNLHGITRLTDKYGIWKIEGNTGNRSVTISSSWGKVKIDAYTGIEIESAGDISIKGRNISISAQNNIKIESGGAIKNARKSREEVNKETSKTKFFFKTVGLSFLDLGTKSMDLSLLRVIYESINPPKEGTLEIKSNRYLLLEAGTGKVGDKSSAIISSLTIDQSLRTELSNIINASETYVHENFSKQKLSDNKGQELIKEIEKVNESNPEEGFENNINNEENHPDPKIINNNIEKLNDSGMKENNENLLLRKNAEEMEEVSIALIDESKSEVKCNLNKSLGDYKQEIIKAYNEYMTDHKDSAREDNCKKYVVQTLIAKYIEKSEVLQMKADQDDWGASVESLKVIKQENNLIKEEEKDSKIKKLLKWYAKSSSLTNDSTKHFTDIDVKNIDEGSIIMSQEEGTSILMSKGERNFKEFYNVEGENIDVNLSILKTLINRNYKLNDNDEESN